MMNLTNFNNIKTKQAEIFLNEIINSPNKDALSALSSLKPFDFPPPPNIDRALSLDAPIQANLAALSLIATPSQQTVSVMLTNLKMRNKVLIPPIFSASLKATSTILTLNKQDSLFYLNLLTDLMLYSPNNANNLPQQSIQKITNNSNAPWTTSLDSLNQTKIQVINALASETFLPEIQTNPFHPSKYIPLFIASSDASSSVASAASDTLKRLPQPNYNDPLLINSLYSLYLGSQSAQPNPSNIQSSGSQPRNPASFALKISIINLLSRSILATNTFPYALQTSFDAIFSPSSPKKLRATGISFVLAIAKLSDPKTIAQFIPFFLSGLLNLINNPIVNQQQQSSQPPKQSSNHPLDIQLLIGAAYEAIGIFANRNPSAFSSDASLLNKFFTALTHEPPNIKISIQNALFNMLNAYAPSITTPPNETTSQIQRIIASHISSHHHHARFAAIKYAANIFPFSSSFARFICIVASADPKPEIHQEALRGLSIPSASKDKPDSSDSFLNTIAWINQHLQSSEASDIANSAAAAAIYPNTKWIQNLTTQAYTNALMFFHRLIIRSADPDAALSDLDSNNLTTPSVPALSRKKLSRFFHRNCGADIPTASSDPPSSGALAYIQFIERALSTATHDQNLHTIASSLLLDLISLGPQSITSTYSIRIDWILTFLSSTNAKTRLAMSHTLGIVATIHLDTDPPRRQKLTNILTSLCNTVTSNTGSTKPTSVDHRQASVLAIGYIIGRLMHRYPTTAMDYVPRDTLSTCIQAVVDCLDVSGNITNNVMYIAACQSITEIGRYVSLTRIIHASDTNTNITWTPDTIMSKLLHLCKTVTDTNTMIDISLAMCHVCIGTRSLYPTVHEYMTKTMPNRVVKSVETVFDVGEVVTDAVLGFESDRASRWMDLSGVGCSVSTSDGEYSVERIVDEWISMMDSNTQSLVTRKVIGVWLLCLVRYSYARSSVSNPDTSNDAENQDNDEHMKLHPGITSRITQLHQLFLGLMTDKDPLIQETGIKGVCMMHKVSPSDLQSDLASRVMDALGRRNRGWSAPGTSDGGDGGDVATRYVYQCVVTIVSNISSRDMIYRVLNMIPQNDVWASRYPIKFDGKGDMSTGIDESSMMNLVCKVYRYMFDTNARVSQVMRWIWNQVVMKGSQTGDGTETEKMTRVVWKYRHDLMKELVQCLGDRDDRTRVSSTRAMTDMLTHIGNIVADGNQKSVMDDMDMDMLRELWIMVYRVMDDVSDRVRASAAVTVTTLTNMTIRYCESVARIPEDKASKDKLDRSQCVVDTVMKLMVTNGMVSTVNDVRRHALTTITKLCRVWFDGIPDGQSKHSIMMIRHHIVDVMCTILECMSSMEPGSMNYISFHIPTASQNDPSSDTNGVGITRNELDGLRGSMTQMSPMMALVEFLVSKLDTTMVDDVMHNLVPRLNGLIRRGVGLPTRIATARCVYLVAKRHQQIVSADGGNASRGLMTSTQADSVLKAVSGVVVTDRSASVRRAYASAAAWLISSGSVSWDACIRFIRHMLRGYLVGFHRPTGDTARMNLFSGTDDAAGGDKDDGFDGHEETSIGLGIGEDHDVDTVAKSASAMTVLEIVRSMPTESLQKLLQHDLSTTESQTHVPIHVLTVSYIGTFDTYPDIRLCWQQVWSENTGSSVVSSIKYWTSVTHVCGKLIRYSDVWSARKMAAMAVGRIVSDLPEDDVTSGDASDVRQAVMMVVPMMLDALTMTTRIWDGKQSVVETLAAACVRGKQWLKHDGETGTALLDRVVNVLMQESHRGRRKKTQKNDADGESGGSAATMGMIGSYRRVALESLARLCEDVVDMPLNTYATEMEYWIDTACNDDEMRENDTNEVRDRPMMLVERACVFKALGQCLPSLSNFEYRDIAHRVVRVLCEHGIVDTSGQVWNVRLSAMDGLDKVLQKTNPNLDTSADHSKRNVAHDSMILNIDLVRLIVDTLVTCVGDHRYTVIRTKGVDVMEHLMVWHLGFDVPTSPSTSVPTAQSTTQDGSKMFKNATGVDARHLIPLEMRRDVCQKLRAMSDREQDLPLQHRIKRIVETLSA